MLIHTKLGHQEELNCFKKVGNAEAKGSCSITWQGQFYIYGGTIETTQISRLTGHKLERVGSLEFEHRQAQIGKEREKSSKCFKAFVS